MPDPLHPAEHRGYRELYVAGRQLLGRWRNLSAAVADTGVAPALDNGALRVREMLEGLEPLSAAYDLHLGPAAGSIATGLAGARSAVMDRSLDTGPAVRLAVLDIEHVTTLLLQLAELAAARGDGQAEDFCREWAKRLRAEVKAVRKAAVELGRDPDRVAQPLDDSPLGQAAHRAAVAIGTAGEWFDRRAADARSAHEKD